MLHVHVCIGPENSSGVETSLTNTPSVMLFFIFFPTYDVTESVATLASTAPTRRRDAVIVGGCTLISLMVVFITSVALVAAWPHRTQNWANILGAIAGVLAAIQYVPQIYYTYMLGDLKSLSLFTIFMQAPGSFLFALSLYLRVGADGWSTWLVYIVTGALQGVLFALGVYFLVKKRQEARKQVHDGLDDDEGEANVEGVDGAADVEAVRTDERTPLLQSRQIGTSTRGDQGHGNRGFGMLYAATPPEHDSDADQLVQGRKQRRKKSEGRR